MSTDNPALGGERFLRRAQVRGIALEGASPASCREFDNRPGIDDRAPIGPFADPERPCAIARRAVRATRFDKTLRGDNVYHGATDQWIDLTVDPAERNALRLVEHPGRHARAL
jgi:hypothetical protein